MTGLSPEFCRLGWLSNEGLMYMLSSEICRVGASIDGLMSNDGLTLDLLIGLEKL